MAQRLSFLILELLMARDPSCWQKREFKGLELILFDCFSTAWFSGTTRILQRTVIPKMKKGNLGTGIGSIQVAVSGEQQISA